MDEVKKAPSGFKDLVVIGSSAGGIEALSVLVSTLPTNFPAPIVLAQHLDASRPSSLDSILQRRTVLPVNVVTARTAIEAGKIYVVPAKHQVSIQDHYIEVREDQQNRRPRPSVDGLFSSAAEAYGERLIAVILTGSDGVAGAVDVKNAGGTVIVQNPQTARYPSMPLALPPTVIDFEANIERIGPLLYDLLTGGVVPRFIVGNSLEHEERAEDALRSILEQVTRQASMDFRSYKTSTILRRIGRRMMVTHCASMREYLEYLRVYPEEVGELVKAFLIKVTQFFRDANAFTYLKSEILPKLIARARSRDHALRFWAAGCSTGEEPYSLAMLVTDLLGAELPEWSVKIFATDLDEAAINFARRGLYSENLLKSVPIEYRDRFFERVDHGYRISKTLRQMVIYGQQDLSRSAPFPRIDLVLCRNVLIYFTPELQDYVLNQFAFSLSPGGYLFLGKAETVRPNQAYYELVNKHWKVYRCIGNALPAQNYTRLSESHVQSSFRRLDARPNRTTSKQLSGQVEIRQQLETVRTVQAQLMNELSSADKRLNEMNKELMDFKEELRGANEELMLTREELQASIEEFKTTKEELQATNEELESKKEELQEMERLNRLKDDFLSLASHELRTPLSAIKGNAELILRSLKSQVEVASKGISRDKAPRSLDIEQEEHMLGRIIGQANRMNKLISEMLDMTRIRADMLELKNEENINIVELARRIVEQYDSATNHPLVLQIGQDAIVGNWDKARLEQVLDNLINNAVKYSPPDTPVTIGVERRSESTPEVIVWVRDEGYGISEEEQAHIFDRFYRGRANEQHNVEGLGLGLYISHEIITRQGGRMWLESKPGAGSTFYFSLPL